MPCDTKQREVRERKAREAQIKALEQALKAKSARLVRKGNTLSIEGWTDRGDWCDECAVRKLKLTADFTIRRLVAEATAQKSTSGLHIDLRFGHEHTH